MLFYATQLKLLMKIKRIENKINRFNKLERHKRLIQYYLLQNLCTELQKSLNLFSKNLVQKSQRLARSMHVIKNNSRFREEVAIEELELELELLKKEA
jgi:hypothetical protein